MNELRTSEYTFSSLFAIIHNQDDRIFCEYFENFKTHEISYKDFEAYIYKTVSFIRANVKDEKNSFIGVAMENCVNSPAFFWGVLASGYRLLLVNPRLPQAINSTVLKSVGCKTVITNDRSFTDGLDVNTVFVKKSIGTTDDISSLEPAGNLEWADEIALSTTATSTNAKTCVFNGKAFTNEIVNAGYIIKSCSNIKEHYNQRLKHLMFLPFYHIFGLIAVYMWFSVFGRTMVFISDYSANTILSAVRRHQVTHIFAVPLFWHSVYREIRKQTDALDEKTKKKLEKGQKLTIALQSICPKLGRRIARKLFKLIVDKSFGDSIKFMISGGGYINEDALKLFNAVGYPLYVGYGATEIGITSVELRMKAKHRAKGSVGKPLPSVSYQIENGELTVSGTSLCDRIIRCDGTVEKTNGRVCVHDIAHTDKDGYWYIDGRSDDVVIGHNGEKINPDLIEHDLFIPSVQRFVVTDIEGKLTLVVEAGKNPNTLRRIQIAKESEEAVKNAASNGYVIEQILWSEDPIANENAIKVGRAAMKKLIAAGKVTLRPFTELKDSENMTEEVISSETEKIVMKIMADILGRDVKDIKAGSDFISELGGSSLDYFSLLKNIENEFDITLSFENRSARTPAEFAEYITKKKTSEN